MAVLHLFRHAKSRRDDPSLDDHDRPLAPRGREAAPLMARWMADSDVVPGLVLVSTARRTRETWTLMRPAFKPAPQVEFEEALYLASDEELLDRIRRLSDEHEEVMLIGHNPGLHDLAIHLVAGHGIEYGRLAEKYPTAALCTVDFGRKSWGRITAKSGRLARFVRPVDVHED